MRPHTGWLSRWGGGVRVLRRCFIVRMDFLDNRHNRVDFPFSWCDVGNIPIDLHRDVSPTRAGEDRSLRVGIPSEGIAFPDALP